MQKIINMANTQWIGLHVSVLFILLLSTGKIIDFLIIMYFLMYCKFSILEIKF